MSRRVFLCAGHMIDLPERAEPRFPPVKEEAVRARMAAELDRWRVGEGDLAVCGGARGADLLFAELAYARGAEVWLLLAAEPEAHLEDSVRLPLSDWERRFDRFRRQAERGERCEIRVQTRELGPLPEGDNRYARNNRWQLDTARREAGGDDSLFLLLVWDEQPTGDGPGGTSDLATRVAEGLPEGRCAIVNPLEVEPFARDLHWARDGRPKRILTLDGGGVRGVLTLQYLKRIEGLLKDQHGRAVRLCDYFDLIAGTSTGAIIAASLALGMSAAKVEKEYRKLAAEVFRHRWYRLGALRAKFDAAALTRALKGLFEERTVGSTDLRTGLLIVTKRIDSGSQWPLANNPRAKYFHARPGSTAVPNGDYPLWRVVRASTAAPHYFEPEKIEVHPGQEKEFIDGGVSTANNPTLEALKLVTLRGFGVCWPTGANELLIVSCGTGRADASEKPSAIAGKHALVALTSVLNDCADLVETVMQWVSRSPTARSIDGDIGDLAGDLLTTEPLCTYRRFNVEFTAKWLQRELGGKLSPRQLERLQEMDLPANIGELVDLGKLSAERHLEPSHLPDGFKLDPAASGQPANR